MELLAALGTGFIVIFSMFVVAFVALLVFIAVWAIRQDSVGRKAWYRNLGGRDNDEGPGEESSPPPA
jgi:hypothetical protein